MIEKIMEEIGELYVDETGYGYECNLKEYSEVLCGNCCECIKSACKVIIRKHMNDGWIPVDRELPPNAKHEGAFCPKYQVMTKYGVTEGWYNPDAEGWYVLIWFMTDRYLESEIDFDKGDNPKIVFLPDEVNSKQNILTAWKEAEPYHSERSDNYDRE
jgi:hypothetical protein